MLVNRKVVVAILLTVGSLALAAAQTRWSVPKLHELGGEDRIQRHKTVLSQAELSEIRKITAKTIRECDEQDPFEDEVGENLFRSLRVHRVQLGDDGRRALIVQFSGVCMCGGTGNCPLWVVAVDPGGYRVLLRAYGVQRFQVQNAVTRSSFDIVTASHGSASDSFLSRYQFDGTRYRRVACAEMSYMNPENPTRGLNVPIINPERCSAGPPQTPGR